jgi:hypothetical protein
MVLVATRYLVKLLAVGGRHLESLLVDFLLVEQLLLPKILMAQLKCMTRNLVHLMVCQVPFLLRELQP